MQLKVTMADGETTVHTITPAIRVAFEKYANGGFYKVLREAEREEHGYWLAWECLRRSGRVVPMFGEEFLSTLVDVEVIEDAPNS